MKKLLPLMMLLMSTSSHATPDNDVENYCFDFGVLVGSLVVPKANSKPIDLSSIIESGEIIGKKYGTPNYQSWAERFSTTMIRKVSNMSYSEVVDLYNQNNGDLVKLTSVFKYVCHKQIK
jgi:hypothetical protein